jgi:hypothetical protein
MKLQAALKAYIATLTGLTPLVGAKIFYKKIPQKTTLNYIEYHFISAGISSDLNGKTKYEYPAIQFTVYATSDMVADAIGDVIRAGFTDHHGNMGGLDVMWVELLNDLPGTAIIDTGTEVDTLYLEYRIHYNKGDD